MAQPTYEQIKLSFTFVQGGMYSLSGNRRVGDNYIPLHAGFANPSDMQFLNNLLASIQQNFGHNQALPIPPVPSSLRVATLAAELRDTIDAMKKPEKPDDTKALRAAKKHVTKVAAALRKHLK
jgi:hypothetical protein